MKGLLRLSAILVLVISCGKIETPEEFFNITGDSGNTGESCYTEALESGVNIVCGTSKTYINTGGLPAGDKELFYVEICREIGDISRVDTLLLLGDKYLGYLVDSKGKKGGLSLLLEGVRYVSNDERRVGFSIISGKIDCEKT